MSDTPEITDEMIEAAAKAIYLSQYKPLASGARWDRQEVPNETLIECRVLARAALAAVLPMMDGWQPIADYKDDGLQRQFLVAQAGEWVDAATWAKTKYHGEGWLEGGDFANRDSYTARPLSGITHFRTLPPPPKGDGT